MSDPANPISKINAIENETAVMSCGGLDWINYNISQQAIAQNIEKQKNELTELNKEQNKVRDMQRLQQHTVVVGEDDGSMHITEEIRNLLHKAREYGAIIPDYKGDTLTRDQRIDLQDRLRTAIENKNQDNDMRLQGISRITNILHEMYAMMRSIMRTIHEAHKAIIRKYDSRG